MRILITRHDKIGDFITTLPMFKVIKEQTDHTTIALVSKINYDLAQEIDYIDEVILYDKNYKQLSKIIKKKDIDLSISAFIDNNLGLALLFAGIPKRIAPATKLAQIFFNQRVKQRRSQVKMCEWEYNLELLKAFDPDLKLTFNRPIIPCQTSKIQTVAFHPGFGGSSDGNLSLDDYINLARSIKDTVNIAFTFGPADNSAKKYIKDHLDFDAEIKDNFKSLMDFSCYIKSLRIFVSTSTGPMHLAGAVNTRTLSFFGNSLFASDKRWKPLNDLSLQSNFLIPENYDRDLYNRIESELKTALTL